MRKIFTIHYLFFSFFCLTGLNAQTTFIPDPVFEQFLIDENYDSDGMVNGEVLTSDISGITILDIKDKNIKNFKGLESFISLKEFYLTSNLASTISGLSFRENLQLTTIYILEAPGLSRVDVSSNIELTSLQVVTLGVNFYDINIDANIKLTSLSLAYNELEFLDLSNNSELTFLALDGNPIGNIDISNNPKLETLLARDCPLLTAVNLNNGFESTDLESVLLTGNPELLCIKVGDVALAESETGWDIPDTASYTTDFGPKAENPLNSDVNYDAFVGELADLDDLFGVDSGNKFLNKKALAVQRQRWRRNRRTTHYNDDTVDFPNKGAGIQDYYFEYIVTNDCGWESIFKVKLEVQGGYTVTDELSTSVCNNTIITTDYLSSLLIYTNNEFVKEGFPAQWYAKSNGGWVKSDDDNFGNSDFFKLVSQHHSGDDPESLSSEEASTISVNRLPCSVTYTLANVQNTTEGGKDFFEADVYIESSQAFKLGSGQLYFNYNTLAFGENISANNKIEYTQPTGSILEEVFDYPVYKEFTHVDDTSSRVSISFLQSKSASLIKEENVTSMPRKLLHLKIEYTDVSKPSNFVFQTGDSFLDKTFTACGPYNSFDLSDCSFFAGAQITDVTVENSGAVLSVGDENLSNSISVYPNPVSDNLIIDSNLSISKVEIYSVLGQKLKEVNSDLHSLTLSNLSRGIYMMKIYSENSFTIKKIIKQ